MSLSELNAISPIDGRYRNKVKDLAAYFSEEALIKYRVLVEIEYFISLCEIPLPQLSGFNSSLYPELKKVYEDFTSEDAQKIKDIEEFNSSVNEEKENAKYEQQRHEVKPHRLGSRIEYSQNMHVYSFV